jgi:hypothetical protein
MLALLPVVVLLAQNPDEPKLATLEGSVLHAAQKTPIRKAKVSLTAIGSEGSKSVDTGDDGKFALKDVKPGRYRLSASKPGYEATGYGARKPGDAAGQVLRVDPGANLTKLDIRLPKQGVISGKILDADSEPVSKVLVMALANTYYQGGRRTRLPRGTLPAITNDLGEYRVGELPPGKYIVCAVPAGFYQPTPGAKESQPGSEEISITTCYPNVQQMGESPPLEIRDSSEIPGIDIRLIKTRTVTVQGRITGAPASGGSLSILNLNTKTSGPIGNVVSPRAYVMTSEGKFEFKNVAPGSYILHTLPTGLGTAPFVVKAALEVGNQPITDLQVPAVVPFEVKAKIDAEAGPDMKLPSVRLVLTSADDITAALAMATPNADGDLTLSNVVPGKYRVNLSGIPATHYVREIRVDDTVADDDTVELSNAAAKVKISLAAGKAEISGIARNDKGDPVAAANIGLIPEPRRPFRLKMTRTDQNGNYKLSNLPPGDYYLVALESVEAGALEDDEFLKPVRSKLKKVKVEDTGSQGVDLTVLPPPSEP